MGHKAVARTDCGAANEELMHASLVCICPLAMVLDINWEVEYSAARGTIEIDFGIFRWSKREWHF